MSGAAGRLAARTDALQPTQPPRHCQGNSMWGQQWAGTRNTVVVPVDNRLYDRPGDIWWDEREPLSMLRTMLNPARLGYFRQVLGRLGLDPAGLPVLDVGCGGGFLAEELARLGCSVTGIDPSAPTVLTARRHAAGAGLAIDYRVATGESIPFPDDAFAAVACCDVLEHVDDLDRVVAEIGRVLRPGGVLLYDTVNRTALTWLVAIKLAQDWRWTRFLPRDLHDWRRFIRPGELRSALGRHGLRHVETVGLWPAAGPARLLLEYARFRRGRVT